MKEEFDLEHYKKEMPYRAPAGFFEGITQATLQEAKRREAAAGQPLRVGSWKLWSVAASVLVLLVAGYFLLASRQPSAPALATTVPTAPSEKVLTPETEPTAVEPQGTLDTAQKLPTASPAPAKIAQKSETLAPRATPQEVKPESLDKLLATLTDEELAELAAMASTESLAHEETL